MLIIGELINATRKPVKEAVANIARDTQAAAPAATGPGKGAAGF